MENEEQPTEPRKIVDIPPAEPLRPTPSPLSGTGPSQVESILGAFASEESWIRLSEAAKLLRKQPGVISRWVDAGKVRDNGKTHRQRRVLKTDILLIKQQIEEKDAQNDEDEIRRDRRDRNREL